MSSFKLKKIFYENDVLPVRNPIYSQYNGQTIGATIVDDTRSRRRSGGRPSIKGALGIDLETRDEFLLYLCTVKSWYEVLSHIREHYNISDEVYAICDGDENLQRHLEEDGYNVQQCTNHFVKTSMYYLWNEEYPKDERMKLKKEISKIISTLKNSVEKHRVDHDFARLGWRIDETQKELLSIADELRSSGTTITAPAVHALRAHSRQVGLLWARGSPLTSAANQQILRQLSQHVLELISEFSER